MRLLIVVNVDWFFLSHRLPLALGALNAGYEVHIATSLTQGRKKLESYGLIVHPLDIDRSGVGPIGLMSLFIQLIYLFWVLRPDILHLVTIKPVLIGGIAARFAPVRGVVFAISGLGHIFLGDGIFCKFRRILVGLLYRFSLKFTNMRIIFQNLDDRREIEVLAPISPGKVVMIPGSGVDLIEHKFTPIPRGIPVVLMASRLLGTKGVREFIEAAHNLRISGVVAKFWLSGAIDSSNPASISSDELQTWVDNGDIEFLGSCSNIPELMAQTSIVVLPSYREGLPKVLIEAAACGRPVITTDVPGCRDAIEPLVTGILVPAKDVLMLAMAIKKLVENHALCESMGLAGRRRAQQMFDVNKVVRTHLDIYNAIGKFQ